MQSSNIYTKDSVYVSQNAPYKNYYDKSCLICETYCGSCCSSEEEEKDILVKFNFCENPVPYSLKKAVLVLPVMNFTRQCDEKNLVIDIFRNLQNYSARGVVWQNKPPVSLYKTERISQSDLKSGRIELDITPLVWQWITGENENYGITLLTETCGHKIVVDNSGINSPHLELFVYEECVGYCSPAIQLQCTNQKGEELQTDRAVRYNQIITCTPAGYYIDKTNGDITIQKPGYYNFQWTVEFEGCQDMSEVEIAVKNMQTGTAISFSCPGSAKSECAGSAMVQCSCPMQKFRIINSGKSIHLADTAVQSNLVILKV